jgi:hypothetical protein
MRVSLAQCLLLFHFEAGELAWGAVLFCRLLLFLRGQTISDIVQLLASIVRVLVAAFALRETIFLLLRSIFSRLLLVVDALLADLVPVSLVVSICLGCEALPVFAVGSTPN